MRTAQVSILGFGVLLVLLSATLLLIDRAQPQAGAWALVGLSLTVGFLHGALDAAILQRRFTDWMPLTKALVAYLFAVVVIGFFLSVAVNVALWLLILMSVWHFGEPYGRWSDLQPWSASLTRAVVGGVPIMVPVWLVPGEFAQTLAPLVDALAVQVWRVMATVWLALLLVWVLACGLKRPHAARYAWAELFGCAVAYAVFSPLMAFAIYFGLYHAPVHIWRVRRGWTAGAQVEKIKPWMTATGLIATVCATWLLGAGLWWLISPAILKMPEPSTALRWLIVALAAVTAPHLVLISASAAFLAANPRSLGGRRRPSENWPQ
jgi:Brp/Blh family beta-carotene 15,15'-monooxygenase